MGTKEAVVKAIRNIKKYVQAVRSEIFSILMLKLDFLSKNLRLGKQKMKAYGFAKNQRKTLTNLTLQQTHFNNRCELADNI